MIKLRIQIKNDNLNFTFDEEVILKPFPFTVFYIKTGNIKKSGEPILNVNLTCVDSYDNEKKYFNFPIKLLDYTSKKIKQKFS